MSASLSTTRRRFVNWFLGTSVGALVLSILYPVLRFISPPKMPEATTNEVDAGPVTDPELAEKGFKIVRFGAEPVILIKAGENDFRAFTATCTHLECIVEYRKDKRLIWCNCHDGQYDLSGRNIAGPPPKPLTPLKVNLVRRGAGQPPSIVISRS
ncbi:MAG: plastoquinol--plastocyanin reductase [Acidobacteria bacterium]|nr:MAG: plastoquinol--plastocyanin reductase [Acidobacteriota bacterium]